MDIFKNDDNDQDYYVEYESGDDARNWRYVGVLFIAQLCNMDNIGFPIVQRLILNWFQFLMYMLWY